MQEIVATVEQQIDALLEQAKDLVDEYWAKKLEAQDTRSIDEWGKYGVRVRRRDYAISIDWSFCRFVGPKGSKKVFSDYIPRGRKNHRYSMSAFSKAPEWEKDLIDELEEKFGLIRQEAECLRKIVKEVKQHDAFRQRNGLPSLLDD